MRCAKDAGLLWVRVPPWVPKQIFSAFNKRRVLERLPSITFPHSTPPYGVNKDAYEMPFSEGAWFRVKTYLPGLELWVLRH